MQIGMIGLGRMGANMVRRLARDGHQCVVYDLDPDTVETLAREHAGIEGVTSPEALAAKLAPPRSVWMMVPSGSATDQTVDAIGAHLDADDILIDGGNSHFKDDVRRAAALAERGIRYLDAGTSGGVWGMERGYCLMVGGPQAAFRQVEPALRTLAPGPGDITRTPGREGQPDSAERGYFHCGPSGAGHFVKMVHNGIEYGLMQAYAEGFDLLRGAASDAVESEYRYDIDVAAIAELWRRGSVIGSWLLDLTAAALREDPKLDGYSGFVEDSGEGRWTVQTAVELAVPADVLAAALFTRFRSRSENTFAEKMLSAMREQFGGHAEKSLAERDPTTD